MGHMVRNPGDEPPVVFPDHVTAGELREAADQVERFTRFVHPLDHSAVQMRSIAALLRRHAEFAEPSPRFGALRHEGFHVDRLAHESSSAERIFAERWKVENAVDHFRAPVLLSLVRVGAPTPFRVNMDEDGRLFGIHLTQRDATLAASIIQWLGTNVGGGFVQECLREAGYTVGLRK
jgi:hypothetical protein